MTRQTTKGTGGERGRKSIQRMSLARCHVERERLEKLWDEFSADIQNEGHGGSPGEWIVEAMDECQTRIRKLSRASSL